MKKENTVPPIINLAAYLLSFSAFLVGFWHAHLGLKNQHFFGSEYGSLVIASIILLLILISYYFAIVGKKIALLFYAICAFSLVIFNLNYFYPYDFKEDLVKEDAAAIKDSLISFSTRSNDLIEVEPKALKDDLKLRDLGAALISEVRNQGGFETKARENVAQINKILNTYQIAPFNLSLSGNLNNEEKAKVIEEWYHNAIESFRVRNSAAGVNLGVFDTYNETKLTLEKIKNQYVPVLEKIISDTTKIDISNDKKNIENNPENIAEIAKIVSEINSATKSVNEIKKENPPFTVLEATITKLGSIGHTLPSMKNHIQNGTKEQKVGTWKNIIICLLIDLLVPLAIYIMLRRKGDSSDLARYNQMWNPFKDKNKPTSY